MKTIRIFPIYFEIEFEKLRNIGGGSGFVIISHLFLTFIPFHIRESHHFIIININCSFTNATPLTLTVLAPLLLDTIDTHTHSLHYTECCRFCELLNHGFYRTIVDFVSYYFDSI